MARYLTEADVAQVLNMRKALDAVEAAHLALSRGEAVDVPRRRVRGGGAMQHLLQAAWPARGVMGFKAYTSSASGARFWVHLFDADSGAPVAVLEANLLGMLRTGAAAGLAARCLSRADSRVAGIIGAGWQARGQMLAIAAVREIECFKVFARRKDKLDAFCREMADALDVKVEAVSSAEHAVRESDIVVTATSASRPVIEADWLSSGMHVCAMGSNSLLRRELDEASVARADLICVDSRDAALGEAGDLAPLLEKGKLIERQLIELGDVLAGRHPGRQESGQITLFESQGLAIQDLALAALVLQEAGLSDKLSAMPAAVGQQLPY